jgi:hypothetical protein
MGWAPLAEKNWQKLDIWMGGTMSIAGRTTMINSSLTSSFIYHMSMYLMPKTVVEELYKQRRTFFWQRGSTKKKIPFDQGWGIVWKSKKMGGLGIKDIREINISLLCKWWWRLENEKGLWQDIVRAKYLRTSEVGMWSINWMILLSDVIYSKLQIST